MSIPVKIEIRLGNSAKAVIERLATAPPRMMEAVRVTMDQQNQYAIGHTTEARLTGRGPFSPADNRLGVVTGKLRQSLRSTPAAVSGKTVVSAIGTNLRYAGVHEFGFSGTVSVRPHSRRNQGRDRFGLKNPKSLGDEIKKTASGVSFVKGHSRKMNMPERAPIRTGIQDRQKEYGRAMSAAIVQAISGGNVS
jgi:phage gpG-like protein